MRLMKLMGCHSSYGVTVTLDILCALALTSVSLARKFFLQDG
jgi:hypothetical protein